MIKPNNAKLILAVMVFIGGGAIADGQDHNHHKFAKDVDHFHSVLAPVWHARPGTERTQDACAKAGEMARLAKEIRSTDASQLVASIPKLKTKCDSDKAGVDAALFDVHEAFHHLIDAQPGLPSTK
ncbi:MAG: hypothetical protein U0989_20385 [Azonexus sp.]|nr:hypothetical protein [Azonexus sp.]MDP3638780.1 hypothetical protein [Azonexus sp.]MDZ4317109.1 hypothetical protein [Azonexus sp.]